jgi:hypothetical protein
MGFRPLFPKSVHKMPVRKRVYKREKITVIYNYSGPLFRVILVTGGIIDLHNSYITEDRVHIVFCASWY